MHVHHLWYADDKPAPWNYEDEALITLCFECHEKEEFNKHFTFPGIKYLASIGVMHTDFAEIIRLISQARDRENFPGMREYMSRLIQHMRHA